MLHNVSVVSAVHYCESVTTIYLIFLFICLCIPSSYIYIFT